MIDILQAESEKQIVETRHIFREYEAWLGLDLCFQGFETELAGLPGKYKRPDGRLLLAYSDEVLAGCVAMRKLDEGICEMKRLFVRDTFRGLGLGNLLVERVMAEARLSGYGTMRLDTYPAKMGKAVSLYESHGFLPIGPYYSNPHDDVIFMQAEL